MSEQPIQLGDFNPHVVLDGEEIAVTFGDHEAWRLHWLDVDEIVIWRDESSVDQPLCFGLRTRTMKPGRYYGVPDSAKGFSEALEEIDRRFESAYSLKWKEAVFPPMATQWAVVYGVASERAEHADVVWPEAA